ncbi:MAG: DUF6481 family protein [bacterium]|nr:DUF6481 family protein [bacterium]
MVAYKQPSLAERTALAQNAKQKLLDKMRAKPPVDPAVLAERLARAEAKEAAAAEARAARLEAIAKAKADKIAAAVVKPKPTPEEQKAARDARYAARKQRNS